MADAASRFSWPLQIVFRFVLTIGLVWILSIKLEQYFFVDGGIAAIIIVSSLLTLMNIIVRPVLHIVFAPFHLIFGLIATILMNFLFIWLIQKIADQLDPSIVVFSINGGVGGWLVIAIILGTANWLMKVLVRA